MQRPTALGLFLCDQVSIEADTSNRHLLGLFDTLVCREVPFSAPPFTVYAALTDGQGRITLTLDVTDIDDEVELASETAIVELPSPLSVAHVRIRLRGLTFSDPGQYLFALFAQGEPICHRRLQIRQSEA